MTAPNEQQTDNKMSAAKALFIGFFAAALGWAGVLVAAVAVATEQTWSNGRPERERAAARRGSWLDTQRDWLAADHGQRMARAAAHRDWLKSGANPDNRPASPGRASRLGAALRRAAANIVVAGSDFGKGFRSGWAVAADRRRQGASFQEIRRARPNGDQPPPATLPPDHEQDDRDTGTGTGTGTGTVIHPTDSVRVDILQTGALWAWTCRSPYCPGKGFDYPTQKAAEQGARQHVCGPNVPPVDGSTPRTRDTQIPASADTPAGQEQPNPEGAPMSAPTVTPTPNTPTADSNAVVLADQLAAVNATVTGMSDDTDALNTIVTTLNQKITAAADLAHSAGMPTAAANAVDATRHATALISARLDDFATGTTAATDQLTAAANGLRAVQNAEDTLRAAGADGRALDTTAV